MSQVTQTKPGPNDSKDRSLSRRRFLQLSAAGVAATLGAASIDLSPVAAAAVEARRQTGTLRVAWEIPATLNPLSASSDTEISFLNAIYDYLIDTDANSQLVPRLAESWEISDDGLTYTLKLHDGVKFHDGSDLTPDDVLWTFDFHRAAEGTVAGLLSNVTSIEAGDGNTVVFTLSQSNPDFLYSLTDNKTVILKKDTVPQNADGTYNSDGAFEIGFNFNGTGPFVLDEIVAGFDRAVLHANADYWGGAPGISSLEFIYFSDPDGAISAVKGGVVDVVLRMSNEDFLELSGDASFSAANVPTSGHDLVRLRADREPGNNPDVQKAFKLATDRSAIFERIQFGFGAEGKDSPIGPVFGQYFATDLAPAPRDPEAAKALLVEAGYPDGLDLKLHVPDTGNRPDFAITLKDQWEEAGIRVEIELQDEATYYADDGWLEVDLGITGWGARPVPQLYLEFYVKSDAPWNESHWSDPEIDALVALAGSSLDEAERTMAYHRIQQVMLDHGPIIIAYFFAQFMVSAASVSGIDLHPFAGRTNFNTASIA